MFHAVALDVKVEYRRFSSACNLDVMTESSRAELRAEKIISLDTYVTEKSNSPTHTFGLSLYGYLTIFAVYSPRNYFFYSFGEAVLKGGVSLNTQLRH